MFKIYSNLACLLLVIFALPVLADKDDLILSNDGQQFIQKRTVQLNDLQLGCYVDTPSFDEPRADDCYGQGSNGDNSVTFEVLNENGDTINNTGVTNLSFDWHTPYDFTGGDPYEVWAVYEDLTSPGNHTRKVKVTNTNTGNDRVLSATVHLLEIN